VYLFHVANLQSGQADQQEQHPASKIVDGDSYSPYYLELDRSSECIHLAEEEALEKHRQVAGSLVVAETAEVVEMLEAAVGAEMAAAAAVAVGTEKLF